MEQTRIFKLKKGDKFNFVTIKTGKKNVLIPSNRVFELVETKGKNSYYTDGKKVFFCIWKRPVFKK